MLFHFYLLGTISNFIIQVHLKKCEYHEKGHSFQKAKPILSEETEDPGAKVSSEWLLMNNKHRQSVEQRHRTGTNTKWINSSVKEDSCLEDRQQSWNFS